MKHLFYDLWASIKKSPFLFIFLFVQIMITSLVLYTVLSNYYWTEEQSGVAQIAWGDKEYFKMWTKMGTSYNDVLGIMLSRYKEPMDPTKDNPEMVRQFEMVGEFFEKAKQIEGLTIIVNENDLDIELNEEKDWDEEDKVIGEYAMFNQNGESYERVYSYYISSNYLDYFKVKLSEGEYFKEEDYLYDNDYIPVLMGDKFKKYYSIGEEFYPEYYKSDTKPFKVVGFVAPNQYFTPSKLPTKVFSYDTRILVPYFERGVDDVFGDYSKYAYLFTHRFTSSYFVTEPQDYERVHQEVLDLLDEVGLGEYYETVKLRISKELSNNYKDQLAISIVVCMATLLFSLFSFVFTMLYKIDGNMKNYAIRMVVGETRTGIAMRYLFESFVLFLLGQVGGFFAFNIFSKFSYLSSGYEHLMIPTIRTGFVLNILFYILTVIILYICINVKLRSYSIATLIRGTNIKKERSLPFYRVVLFVMLAIVGVFSMFIASYQVALDRIDLYYTGYYTKNVKMAYVNPLSVEDAPTVSVNVDKIGAEAPDAIINRYVNAGYRGDDFVEERGIYFNGYIDPVNMIQGRFFTHEEVNGTSDLAIAVVGKEIYDKYVNFNENNEPIYHCDMLDKDLLVIGVIGKEDQATNLDLTIFMPIRLASKTLGHAANYTLDGKDEATVAKLEEVFTRHVSETAMVSTKAYTPRLTVEAPTDLLLMLLIMIIINAVVFCFYYVSKQESIHFIKKLAGYSKDMIMLDTFMDFSLLTMGAFITGNAIVVALKETIFKDVQLFSIYMLDYKVIVFSFSMVILLSIFLASIAIAKTFTAGNYNKYRN
ncbi:MAG: hypothetical protein J6D42_12160 [Clostridia bacterium]|nr:hypothetical protein [Clostridia bacterium]